MASYVVFSVIGAFQFTLCRVADAVEAELFLFVLDWAHPLSAPSHPEKPCQRKPGKEEAAEEEKFPPCIPHCHLLVLRPQGIQMLLDWA